MTQSDDACTSPGIRPATVSVLTGYYNRVHCVDETILSILNQSHQDIELIAFDDCSTDGTGDRLIALRDELADPRFKVLIHESNKGFTQGMIDAIAASDSEFICVQGSGDISLPRRIERQVSALRSDPDIGAVGSWYTNVVETNGRRYPRRPDANGVDFESLMKGNVFSHGEVMIRRSVYEAAGGYRSAFTFCQDYDLWLRIAKISKLHTVKEFLYERSVRFDGASYHPKKFPLQARFTILARRFALMSEPELGAAIARLGEVGPGEFVQGDDPELQRILLKAVLRSTIFGATQEAGKLSEQLTPGIPKAILRTINSIVARLPSRVSGR